MEASVLLAGGVVEFEFEGVAGGFAPGEEARGGNGAGDGSGREWGAGNRDGGDVLQTAGMVDDLTAFWGPVDGRQAGGGIGPEGFGEKGTGRDVEDEVGHCGRAVFPGGEGGLGLGILSRAEDDAEGAGV